MDAAALDRLVTWFLVGACAEARARGVTRDRRRPILLFMGEAWAAGIPMPPQRS